MVLEGDPSERAGTLQQLLVKAEVSLTHGTAAEDTLVCPGTC